MGMLPPLPPPGYTSRLLGDKGKDLVRVVEKPVVSCVFCSFPLLDSEKECSNCGASRHERI